MQTPPCRIRSGNNEARKILVIEPDKTLRAVITDCLRHRDYEVIETSSAQECFSVISGEVYDLAVVDIGLPDQDCLCLLRRLRNDSICRLLVISDRFTLADRLEVYSAGADFIMPRLFDPRELAAVAAGLMQRLAPRSIDPSGMTKGLPYDAAYGQWSGQE